MATILYSSLEALESSIQQPTAKMKTDVIVSCKNFPVELLKTFSETEHTKFLLFDYDKSEKLLSIVMPSREHEKISRGLHHLIMRELDSMYVDEVCADGSADVDLGSRVKCPDESYSISVGPGAHLTTVAVEVAVTRPYVSLLENARLWLESPRSIVNLVLLASTTTTCVHVAGASNRGDRLSHAGCPFSHTIKVTVVDPGTYFASKTRLTIDLGDSNHKRAFSSRLTLLENARLWWESPRSMVNLVLLAKYVPGSTTVTLMVWEKEHPAWLRRSPRFEAPATCTQVVVVELGDRGIEASGDIVIPFEKLLNRPPASPFERDIVLHSEDLEKMVHRLLYDQGLV
ncbi:hypothetical protein V8E54_009260 [Elaphomyces granulatus]